MKTAYSTKKNVDEIVEDLKGRFGATDPKAVLFFASSCFDAGELSGKMQAAFPGASVFGCTTAGEIVSGKMLKQSVVAMAFEPEMFEAVKIVTIEDLNRERAVEEVMSSFESFFNEPVLDMDHEKYVGIILVDGLSLAEERVIDRIGDLTNVTFIGGSAGDDLKFQKTHVFADGKAHSNAAVLALLKPKNGFDVIKTQSFCATGKVLSATKVNEAQREVLQFDGKPAALAYAEARGVSMEEAPKHFMESPVGLMIGGEPYVRSPQQIKEDSMIFYCKVVEGMELCMLKSTDIVEDTRKAVDSKKREIGNISGIINFHCILRTLELEERGETEAYGKVFSDIPTIGFSTYGEQYLGHINQTSTMLVFK